MKENNIYIGTCSWKYDDWKGIVYNSDNINNYLEEYAKIYNSVEIDQWFWSLFPNQIVLPKIETVNEYSKSVTKNFKFTIKVPNSITLTHFYSKGNNDLIVNPNFLSTDLTNKFLEIIQPLHCNIGVLIFQFEYLNKQKMENQNKFIDLISKFINKLSPEFNYGFELRNPNYLNQKYFDFINKTKICHVLLHGYFMPNIYDTFSKYEKYFTRTTVLRIHGEDRKGIEKLTQNKWDKILINRDVEINQLIEIIKKLSEKNIDVYVNVNNHFEGSAPLTIRKIESFLK